MPTDHMEAQATSTTTCNTDHYPAPLLLTTTGVKRALSTRTDRWLLLLCTCMKYVCNKWKIKARWAGGVWLSGKECILGVEHAISLFPVSYTNKKTTNYKHTQNSSVTTLDMLSSIAISRPDEGWNQPINARHRVLVDDHLFQTTATFAPIYCPSRTGAGINSRILQGSK